MAVWSGWNVYGAVTQGAYLALFVVDSHAFGAWCARFALCSLEAGVFAVAVYGITRRKPWALKAGTWAFVVLLLAGPQLASGLAFEIGQDDTLPLEYGEVYVAALSLWTLSCPFFIFVLRWSCAKLDFRSSLPASSIE
jgi:hypothetical protein